MTRNQAQVRARDGTHEEAEYVQQFHAQVIVSAARSVVPADGDGDFDVTIIVRNAKLRRAIMRAGYTSGLQFARAAGVSAASIGDYLNLKKTPYDKWARPRRDATKIAEALSAEFEDLFPDEFLDRCLRTNRLTRTVSQESVTEMLQQIPCTPEQTVMQAEGAILIERALRQLPEKEQFVLRQRFGLGVKELQTLDQLAAKLGLSQERVRQVELSGLRKLKGGSRLPKMLQAADGLLGQRKNRKPVDEKPRSDSRSPWGRYAIW